MKKCKNQNGITLIALVITIIVMLILVAVTITMAVNGGLFDYARRAGQETNRAVANEQELASGKVEINGVWYKSIDEYINTIDNTKDYVGYYADINGDGIVEGIIYADLAIGNTGDGQWMDTDGSYTINKFESVKKYYISQKNYEGLFGIKDVISVVKNSNGEDRFYVMALSDIDTSDYYWYYEACGKMNPIVTSEIFGEGYDNSKTIMGYWSAETPYGEQSPEDLWGRIQELLKNGWFLPSRGEWSAFAEELGVTKENYSEYGLVGEYWSSSQCSVYGCWTYQPSSGWSTGDTDGGYRVRLSTRF